MHDFWTKVNFIHKIVTSPPGKGNTIFNGIIKPKMVTPKHLNLIFKSFFICKLQPNKIQKIDSRKSAFWWGARRLRFLLQNGVLYIRPHSVHNGYF
jgi:hypothetical protein